MRHLIGVGTPRGLQSRTVRAFSALITLVRALCGPAEYHWCSQRLFQRPHVSHSRGSTTPRTARLRWLSPRAISLGRRH
jgi:hypothetical protein